MENEKNLTKNAIHWDMSGFYSSFRSNKYCSDKQQLTDTLEEFLKTVDALLSRVKCSPEIDMDTWAEKLCLLEKLEARYSHLWFYTFCMLSTAGHDEDCLAELNVVQRQQGRLDNANAIMKAALKKISNKQFKQLLSHPHLKRADHHLRICAKQPKTA